MLKLIPISNLTKYKTTTEQCLCPDYQGRKRFYGGICKHIQAVREMLIKCKMHDTTLDHRGKPYCDCDDWMASGDDCLHIQFLRTMKGNKLMEVEQG